MTRGAWLILIGGILLAVGIAITISLISGLLGGFIPAFRTIQPGSYFNSTVELQSGEPLTYAVSIQNHTQGDEVTVSLLLPDDTERDVRTVTTTELSDTYIAKGAGNHTVVVQNTGNTEVTVLVIASGVDITAATWLGIGVILGFLGFIILIVGVVLFFLDRRRSQGVRQEFPGGPLQGKR